MSIYSSVVPILATRNLRLFKEVGIKQNEVDYIAEQTAKTIIPIKFIETEIDHANLNLASMSDITAPEKMMQLNRSSSSTSMCIKQIAWIEATISDFAIEAEICYDML